jgi:hypothetical protein
MRNLAVRMVTTELQTVNIQITTKQKPVFTELYNSALSDVHQLHVPVDNALTLRCFILTYSTQQQMHSNESYTLLNYIHGDHKVSVRLMNSIQKVTSNVQSVPRQSPDIY